MRLFVAALALVCPAVVTAKAVFAHFMVGNSMFLGPDDWQNQIKLAQAAGIDAFALNMAKDDPVNDAALPVAFSAAESLGFKLFFSFDYAGNGAWDKTVVTSLIQKYASSSAYYHRGTQAFVSTFEGPDSANDWKDIKSSTGCFFIPDWSSKGARDALNLGGGVADGLFSWDAWTRGPNNINTFSDASYYTFLGSKPYMAPASPWFYTNLPGYDKNWLWRGDSIWIDRWQQLIAGELQPEFVEIISWNDYGESHYIGPLDDRQYDAFDIGKAPYNYVYDKPHDGWRQLLPFLISMWKTGTASVSQEGVVAWYRTNPASACNDGGTTGNTASQLQYEYHPADVIQDNVFFSAILGSAPDSISVTIGGAAVTASWTKPDGGVGIYSGNASFSGKTGQVVVTVNRGGSAVASMSGASISTDCSSSGGYNNYNAWVGSNFGNSISSVSPPLKVANMKCIRGFGVKGFADLCDYTCKNGYCPEGACTCTALGAPPKEPAVTKPVGFPLAGLTHTYEGLCAYTCQRGFCPTAVCTYTNTSTQLVNPTRDEFAPDTCTGGSGPDPFSGLCDYACNWGFCPMHLCKCGKTGPLNVPVGPNNNTQYNATGGYDDYGLCNFACERDYCPPPCVKKDSAGPGGIFVPLPGDGSGSDNDTAGADSKDCNNFDGTVDLFSGSLDGLYYGEGS